MSSPTPFTFGIPLIARASARNWRRVETLLDLTLTSVFAQTDRDFRIIIAGHDRPRAVEEDPRIIFIRANWPAGAPDSDNRDSGHKKYEINRLVLERGGGLLMFLDADDWVDVYLVETARAMIGPDHLGGIIETGFATDLRTLRAATLPHPLIFDGGFHRICGSSTVAQLRPGDDAPLRRDPYAVFHEHYKWIELAEEHGADLVRLPAQGNYVVNTSENHSEVHGPFADWRQTFTNGVNRAGTPVDTGLAARFGLSLDRIRAASEQLLPTTGRPSADSFADRNPGVRPPVSDQSGNRGEDAMTSADAKQRLVDYLDERAFRPVLDAKPEDYPESKRGKLDDVQRATEAERERFRSYGSAQEVVEMFRDDLSSAPAEDIHRELRDLDLPTINDIRDDFQKLARDLGVRA